MSDAKTAKADAADTADAPKKKGKGKLIVMILGLLVLVGGGVAGSLYFMHGSSAAAAPAGPRLVPKSEQQHAPAGEGAGGHDSEGHAATGGQPTPHGAGGDPYASNYYSLDKDFTSNLRESVHFVQVGVAVSTPYDQTVIDHLKTNEIAVRSAILMTLGDTTEEQVFTSQGKEQLQHRLVQAINATLRQKEGFGGISNVYFTSFVVQ
ncbi:flagellar basal body-associated FliL family protein [Sphingomonas sp.]|uniref:flagellar basal body-associated FliL family protein n=1 Tax=Sphingomonas sp. TaxID=28214 RepID=UPI003CC5B4E9